jgi:hypothetical protein
MRALLLFAAGAGLILLVQNSPVPIGPPPVTCSLAERRCPDVFWFHDIRWITDTPTIRSVEFRELPDRWGIELPFEPVWAAEIKNVFNPTDAAACYPDAGRVVCEYLNIHGDPEDLPWYVPQPRERLLAWCRDPENQEHVLAAARRLKLGQEPVDSQFNVFREEYNDWQDAGGEFTENLDRACQAAYESR